MKWSLLKDGYREIAKSYKRFLSILLMSLLGVGFFAGIRSTSDDMKATLDEYYKQSNVYDIEVMSTLGLTDDDVERIKQIDGVKEVYGGFSRDVLLKFNDTTYAAKALVYDERINVPQLSGKISDHGITPKNTNTLAWCLVDKGVIDKAHKQLGDSMELIETQSSDERVLRVNRFKIIGVVDSPLFISQDRGGNKLGSGKTDFFVYIPKHAVKNDYYTELFITVNGADSYLTDSDAYKKKVAEINDKINEIKEESEKQRYDSLVSEGQEKIDDAQKKLDDKTADAQKKIDDAKQEIKDADKKIKDAEDDIESAEIKLNDAKQEIKAQEKDAYKKINDAREKIKKGKDKILEAQDHLHSKDDEFKESQESIDNALAQLDEMEEQLRASGMDEATIKEQTMEQRAELATSQQKLNAGVIQINEGLKSLKTEWNNLIEKEKALDKKKIEADDKIADAKKKVKENSKKVEDGKNEIKEHKQELKDAKKKLKDKETEFVEKTNEAKEKLEDARQKLDDLKYPKWHIFDRTDNVGYNGLIRDTKSVERLGGLFPLILFVIAALISLNSMTRMVEEQRVQLGTLKALGYSKFSIARKYIRYASYASVIGGIAGMSIGFKLIPGIIWRMYELDYSLPNKFIVFFDFKNGSIGLLLSVFCVLTATVVALLAELKEVPAQLMRPKAPKVGKRVLLEKIDFIWKKLSFNQKVTVRNIFRYKKRFLMTIIGVMGCTALILSGFGLRDSVSNIVTGQYSDVFNFDMMVRLSENAGSISKNKVIKQIKNLPITKDMAAVNMSSVNVRGTGKFIDAQMIVAEDMEDLHKVIYIKDKYSHKEAVINKKDVYLTDKLAELVGAKVGSQVLLSDENDKTFTATVGGILENYLSHYVYIPKEVYEKELQGFKINTIMLNYNPDSRLSEEDMSAKIIDMDDVDAVILSSSARERMNVMIGSLNYVVAVLIIAAALLAFVVLFNLVNLNISERIRELATIKVLGFYDREVYDYLDRETVFLTIIGILLGMPGGYFLNALIVKTCEVDIIRFNRQLRPMSFVLSGVIALGFALCVNVITFFSLKKVNMVESLKSVE